MCSPLPPPHPESPSLVLLYLDPPFWAMKLQSHLISFTSLTGLIPGYALRSSLCLWDPLAASSREHTRNSTEKETPAGNMSSGRVCWRSDHGGGIFSFLLLSLLPKILCAVSCSQGGLTPWQTCGLVVLAMKASFAHANILNVTFKKHFISSLYTYNFQFLK